jgi:phage virion morphogenesis protein
VIEFRLDDAELRKRAKALGAELARAPQKKLMERIAAHGLFSTSRRFETGKGPGGEPWKKSFRALMEGGQTLVDSGRLRDNFGTEATTTRAEWGTNTEYAAIHQFGGVIRAKSAKALRFQTGGEWVMKKSVTIPARPFLGIDEADETEIEAIADAWLQGLVRA